MSRLEDIEPKTDEERWIAKAAVSLYRTLRKTGGQHMVSSVLPIDGKMVSIRLREYSKSIEFIGDVVSS